MKNTVRLAIISKKNSDVTYQLVSDAGWQETLTRDQLCDLTMQAISGLRHIDAEPIITKTKARAIA